MGMKCRTPWVLDLVYFLISNKQTMKTYIILLISLFFSLNSSAYELHIEGTINDIHTGNPVANHFVEISIDTSTMGFTGYNNIVTTNDYGQFEDQVSLPDNLIGIVNIYSDSCGYLIQSTHAFSGNDTIIQVHFQVCDFNSGNDCQAYFAYYQNNEPLSIQFIDQSIGYPSYWIWDFGDGTFSNDQNPQHTYPYEGYFLISLAIEGDSCYSEYEEWILVVNDTTWDCDAYYTYQNVPFSNTIEFYDESIGEVSNWIWDFGDGNFSSLQNPTHTYSQQGIYYTSLSIETIDSCYSYYGDLVIVGNDTVNCSAEFTYQLDTLNNTPHTYLFSDNSVGEIIEWYWDFGDGNESFEQNPTHIFNSSGNYAVCLSITTVEAGQVCYSTNCIQVSTMEYYNFGGQAFIDDYPINIDSTENENIAIAYLYRKIDNSWHYMDQKEFWKYGYYWFANKPVGEYLIKTELKEISLDYDKYAPAYHLNSTSWKGASVFTLTDNQQFAINVSFKELDDNPSGIGSISGNVIGDISCSTYTNINIDHVLVQLFNKDGGMIAYTYSDIDGYYEFTGFALDNYNFKAEYPGRYSETVNIALTSSEPSSTDNTLIVHCAHILDIEENISQSMITVQSPQPNPATNSINCNISTKVLTSLEISVQNINGITILRNDVTVLNDNQTIKTDISSLNPGIYFFKIQSKEFNFQEVYKIIKIQ